MTLNERAILAVEALLARCEECRVTVERVEGGGRLVDCGASAIGGFAAGISLARICLSGLGEVALAPGVVGDRACPYVQVATDHAVAACLASQYAGWALSVGKYFAMGSGPMRAARGKEPLFDQIGGRESTTRVVGVLEAKKKPSAEIFEKIGAECGVSPSDVTLLIARTSSIAGGLQIVARSVETALHKLHESGFDVSRVVSGFGSAPLPPPAVDDLAAIGRTNDAILYGARVVLYVNGDDASIESTGPEIPSNSSRDFGEPFSVIFAKYGHDFYAVDPKLFSPASIVFHNVETGRTHSFGGISVEVLERSFYS